MANVATRAASDAALLELDYIVVGAGSAGCVLANRLSADRSTRVLLLEAGGASRSPIVTMPKGIAKLAGNPDHAWHYPVGPSRAGPGAGTEIWVRGKGLGGSSAINGMIYTRGQPEDYRDWAAVSDEAWGWDAMRAVFKAMEDHELGEDELRGTGGPLHVESCTMRYPAAEALIAAGEQMGLTRKDDLNREEQEGVGYYAHTIRKGRRVSAANAFLDPVRSRANLHVVTGALVERIRFDGIRAAGVVCRVDGAVREFRCSGEIIVAAGALQSPALLQLSGIGPAGHLRSLGIEVISDSPGVGSGYREHLGFSMPFRLKRGAGLNARFRGLGLIGSVAQYYLRRSGPMATGLFEVGAFVRTSPALTRPDVQIYGSAFTMTRADDRSDILPVGVERQPGLTLYGQLLRLTSEGEILIASPDPAMPPAIRPNWFSTGYDRQVAVAMVRYMRRYMAQPALADYAGEELFPGPACQSDEDILEAVRGHGTSGLHGVASCRMGNDNAAVVDARLRVRGVVGLRIADCSIMPTTVSGNTSGPAMAVGWRAADLILSESRA